MDPRSHPFCADAIDTLIELRKHALAQVEKQERRLAEELDDLPRGPLPVMTRAAEWRSRAYHLDLALVGLGYDFAAHGEEPPVVPRAVKDAAEQMARAA